jgi:uncharacterized protein (TIGR00369 family)
MVLALALPPLSKVIVAWFEAAERLKRVESRRCSAIRRSPLWFGRAAIFTPDRGSHVVRAMARGDMGTSERQALERLGRMFASNPIAVHLSTRAISCDPVHGRLTVEFESRPELCNLLGRIHGGVLAAMLDITMSFSAICMMGEGHVIPTIEMTTKFIAPAQPGMIVGKGEVVRKGRSITFMEGRLFDPAGDLLATGSATGQIRPWPPVRT